MSISENSYLESLREALIAYGCELKGVEFCNRNGYTDSSGHQDFRKNPEYINFSIFKKAIGREDWGLMLGQYMSLQGSGPFGYAAIAAPTLLHGMKLLTRFSPLNAWCFNFTIEREGAYYRVAFSPNRELYDIKQGLVDSAFCMLCENLFNRYPVSRYRLELFYSGAEPSYIDRLKQLFPGKIHFGQEQYSLLIPAELCDSPSKFYVEEIWEAALHACKKQVSIMGYLMTDDPVSAVRESIEKVIAENYQKRPVCVALPGIDLVARDLDISESFLRRKLRERRHQFRQIKEECRRDWLQKLLLDTKLSIQVIGYILGYQDASNFTRTCVSWFGETPKELRKRMILSVNSYGGGYALSGHG